METRRKLYFAMHGIMKAAGRRPFGPKVPPGNLIIGDEAAVNTKYFKYSTPLTQYVRGRACLKNETIRIAGVIKTGLHPGSLFVQEKPKVSRRLFDGGV